MATDVTLPDPSGVLDLIEAYRRSKTMFAAMELGVFDAVEKQVKSLDQLAAELKANADALERLLDACVGLGLLVFTDGGYRNSPAASAYLYSQSPRRLTGYIGYSNKITWHMFSHLEDAVREGGHRWKQAMGSDGSIFANLYSTPEAMREFLLGMHGYGLISSPLVVSAFDLNGFRRLVDLGGATGHLAVAACERCPQLRAAVFDLPAVAPIAREMIAQSTAADRVEVVEGDFFADPLPEADLYSLGRILHDWNEEKILLLLRKAYAALPAGGAVLLAEKLLLADRSGARWAQMQNLNMLTVTEGKERTLDQYAGLLEKVGFVNVQGRRLPAPLDAILARKP
jgi:acetylserotonin N-methyltransferase